MEVKQISKSLIKSVFELLGLEIHRKTRKSFYGHTLRETLEQAKILGFNPRVVIDVGAALGTSKLYEAFPNAKHILIEPLEENRPYLDRIVSKLNNAEYLIVAAEKNSGFATINVHPDFDGSSLYMECEDSSVNGVPRIVPAITLDEICKERRLQGPYLIKVDVQGAELDVFAGARHILKDTEYIILEVSLFGFFVGGPQCYDVITFMKEQGFVVYDILDYRYRPLDGAMSQVDIAFVKESGRFRKYHFYATKEQREKLNEKFEQVRNK